MTNGLKTEICILGGGPAGYVAAIRAAQLGASVILVEKAEIGGTCLNWGCIPTKALLKTAETLNTIKKSNEFGITANISSVIISNAVARKNRIVKSLKMGLEYLLANQKVTLVKGEGFIESSKKIRVKTDEGDLFINCNKLIITAGSESLMPSLPGIELEGVIASSEAINTTETPASITIIGAGAIGLEFATLFNALGSKVTVIELQERILPQEDSEITAELLKIMKRHGIKFRLGAKVKEIKKTDDGLVTVFEESETETQIESGKVLVAIGRKLNITKDILHLGLEMNGKAIAVNESMETSISDVFAAGDVIGGKLLAHLAFAEGRVAAENACSVKSKVNYNAVPSCVYTHPEVASVGITEAEAINPKVGRFDFRNNGRALCLGEREGFVKVVVDRDSDVILGAQILCSQASELISEITLAINLGAKAQDVADMIHPHPSLSEAIMEACADAVGIAIHK